MNSYLSKDSINDKLKIDLTLEIKNLFPKAQEEINNRLIETTNDWSCYFFLEEFAEITNKHLKRKEYKEALKYLAYIEKKMKNGNDELVSLLDVAYIENLLWDMKPNEKKQAWVHIPTGIQNRYKKIWSSPV